MIFPVSISPTFFQHKKGITYISKIPKWSYCCCLVIKSCLTLCEPIDCSPPRSSAHAVSRAGEYWDGLPFSSPRIFPTQGSNLYLLHCQVGSLLLSHQGSLLDTTTHVNIWFSFLSGHRKLELQISCAGWGHVTSPDQ